MKYDFDKIINRRGSGSMKWDVKDNELPMWVADMDFEAAPEICDALLHRANHKVFGYTIIPDAWNMAYVHWWNTRHRFHMNKDRLIFCTGVVPAISSIVRKLTTPNENVVIQTPVYPIFFNSIINNGCRVLENPLIYDGKTYQIDFNDLEKKLSNPQTSLMILCNPHNPTGQIWDRDTLARIGDLCQQYGVTVISDEIHCDLTDPGIAYVPFASVSEACASCSITCMAPTKAFNLAGLQTAAVYAPNKFIHHAVWRALNTDEVAEPNAFAVEGAIAAFEHGASWLDALRSYIYQNKQYVLDFIADNLPELSVVPSRATYLLWIDISHYSNDADELARLIREKSGLYVSAGNHFGGNGSQFLRVNIACPLSSVKEGMKRLKTALDSIPMNRA